MSGISVKSGSPGIAFLTMKIVQILGKVAEDLSRTCAKSDSTEPTSPSSASASVSSTTMKTSWKTRGQGHVLSVTHGVLAQHRHRAAADAGFGEMPESNVGAAQAVERGVRHDLRHAPVLHAPAGRLRGRLGRRSRSSATRRRRARSGSTTSSPPSSGSTAPTPVKHEPKAMPADARHLAEHADAVRHRAGLARSRSGRPRRSGRNRRNRLKPAIRARAARLYRACSGASLWRRSTRSLTTFALLDDWDDRYRYVIELGRTLDAAARGRCAPRPTRCRAAPARCGSRHASSRTAPRGPTLSFVGDSDAHIVRGLIAILFALYSGKPAREILEHRCGRAVRAARACAST